MALLVGRHRRYISNFKAARQSGASGHLSCIVTVVVSAQFCKRENHFAQGASRIKLGGCLIFINRIYELEYLRFLCGEIESVSATASNTLRQFEVKNTLAITLIFARGLWGPVLCQTPPHTR